ncbi:peptidylprolyl isomerase [soil metagenome]
MLLALAGQVIAQPSGSISKPPVLFSVKNTPASTEEFIYLYRKNHLNPDDFTENKVNEYLNLFINFKLKVTEAKSLGLDTTAGFLKEFNSYKEELKKPYIAEKDELDRLTKEAYQRLGEEIKAAHILILVKPDAAPADTMAALSKINTLRSRIKAGEDFEKVARESSEDQSAKANSGSLGYFTAMQMVYPFEQAAYLLNVGEVSQPVRTRFGYHLIKVMDRKPARGEVEVSHIILRTGSPDDKKVRNKILEIYDQLRGGRNWDELCKEYSEDQATKDSGGKLRPFGVGALAGIPQFEAVAFSLKTPGEISDPFQTSYGWHIVRLERKIPLPPFSEVEDALKRKVARDERLQIADQKRQEQKKKQYGLIEVSDVKNVIINAADSTIQQGRWKFNGDEAFKTKTLFTLLNTNYTSGDLITFIKKNQAPTGLAPVAYVIQLYDQFLDGKLTDLEDSKLMAGNSDFRNLLTEYKEGILLFTIMEKKIWNSGVDDTVSLRKFYQENAGKYKAGDRVRARLLTTTDRSFLEEIEKKILNHDTLKNEDLKKFKSVQPYRNYEKGENKAVDKVSWTIGLHKTDVDETYFLVEIDNLLPPGIKGFEEARGKVVSDYQDIQEKKWLAELKHKYPVKINNKGKKFVVRELTKK